MNCMNCGFELNENATFCPQCGFQVEAPATTEADFLVEYPEPAKPPKKGKTPLWIGLSAVAVVLVVAIVLNLATIGNFFKKTFSSDEEYFSYISSKDTDYLADTFATLLTADTAMTDFAGKGTVSFELGDAAISLLENSGTTEFDWLSKGALVFDVAMKDDVLGGKMVAKLNGKDIMTADTIMDMTEQTMFFRLPELSNQYLFGTMEDLSSLGSSLGGTSDYDDYDDYYGDDYYDDYYDDYEDDYYADDEVATNLPAGQTTYMTMLESLEDVAKALPDADTTAAVLKRYLDLVYDNLGEVEKKDSTVKVNGISQKATKYTAEIDDKTIVNIMEAFLEEVIEDEELEKIIKDVVETMDTGMDADEVYDSFRDGAEDALDSLKESDMEFDETIEYSIWVDGSGNIVGRALESDSFEVSCLEPKQGNQYALELEISADGQTISFSGDGTVSGNKKTGEYTLEVMGIDLLEVEIKDFTMEKALNGTVELSLSSGVSSLIGESTTEATSMLLDMKIQMNFENTDKKSATKITVFEDDDLFASLEMIIEITDGYDFQIPSKDEAVDLTDESALENWGSSLSPDELLSNLRDAGVPEELLGMVAS